MNLLSPGESLVENELCDEFGLSRTPIRAILTQLEHERLVKHNPYMGTFVTQLTKEDAQEIYEIRGALEAQAALTAVARVSEQEIENMLLVYKRACLELDNKKSTAALNEFRKVHDLIVSHAENQRLSMFIRALENESQRIVTILNQSPNYNPENPLNEKYEILIALHSRDTEKVIQLITLHYYNSIYLADTYLPNRIDVPDHLITPFNSSLLRTAFTIPSYKPN